jgi:hypothetical protein
MSPRRLGYLVSWSPDMLRSRNLDGLSDCVDTHLPLALEVDVSMIPSF